MQLDCLKNIYCHYSAKTTELDQLWLAVLDLEYLLFIHLRFSSASANILRCVLTCSLCMMLLQFPITALREIRILQLLKHENVVNLLEICRTKGASHLHFWCHQLLVALCKAVDTLETIVMLVSWFFC